MPFNGAGLFTQLHNWVTDKANGVLVTASRFQTTYDDMATAFSNCLTRDGQSPALADIPMGGFKITDLDDGVAADDAATVGQVPSLAAAGTFFDAGNSGVALSIDFITNGRNQQFTLTNNATITLGSGDTPGWYTLKILQDATGGRVITWAGTEYSASGWLGSTVAPVMDRVASSICFVVLFWDGTVWWQKYIASAARRSTYTTAVFRGTSSQVITAAAPAADIVFNSVILDPYSEWDTGTGIFTAKVAGLYLVNAAIYVGVTTGGATCLLTIDTSDQDQVTFSLVPVAYNASFLQFDFSCATNLSAGGTAKVTASTSAGAVMSVNVASTCRVTRLGDA